MVGTQVYLTEKQRVALAAISRATGKSRSELIREAVDRFIVLPLEKHHDAVLARSAGIWKNRKDMPNFRRLRREWDRRGRA